MNNKTSKIRGSFLVEAYALDTFGINPKLTNMSIDNELIMLGNNDFKLISLFSSIDDCIGGLILTSSQIPLISPFNYNTMENRL